MVKHYDIELNGYGRGYHLVTRVILKALPPLPENGMMHLLVKHTSAGISLNENADPTVRQDFESAINRLIPEDSSLYRHNMEGPDDMPAHLKSSLIGASLSIPIRRGQLDLGTWQGIYFCEFRSYPSRRRLTVSIIT